MHLAVNKLYIRPKVLHKVQHSFLSFLNNMELYHCTE